MRKAGIGVLALTFFACAAIRVERQRLFLSFGDISGGPGPVICSVQFFDRGLVEYSCGSTSLVAQLPREHLAALQSLVASREWEGAFRDLASQECPECADFAEIHVYYRVGDEEYATHVPVEHLPQSFVPYLERADHHVRDLFGLFVRNRFAPSKNAA